MPPEPIPHVPSYAVPAAFDALDSNELQRESKRIVEAIKLIRKMTALKLAAELHMDLQTSEDLRLRMQHVAEVIKESTEAKDNASTLPVFNFIIGAGVRAEEVRPAEVVQRDADGAEILADVEPAAPEEAAAAVSQALSFLGLLPGGAPEDPGC